MKKISFLMAFLVCIFSIFFYIEAEGPSPTIIYIDPGHGGMDGGAVVDGVKESTLTLAFSKKIKEVFEQEGYEVYLTRQEDVSLCPGSFIKKQDMQKRANLINQSQATLALSIHMNRFSISKYRGAQVFFSGVEPRSRMLAECLQIQLQQYLKNTTRNIVLRDNVYLLNHVTVPCCIVECGFMSNPEEFLLLQQDDYQYKFAVGLLYGVEKYLLLR